MYVLKVQKMVVDIIQAADTLRQGKIIAYPTESCFGLGCDPSNLEAVEQIISLKSRSSNKGLILIDRSVEQAQEYIELNSSPLKEQIERSWPGPNTWLLPPTEKVLPLVRGEFPLLAMRVTAHPVSKQLCEAFGGAIVSTSANISGSRALLTADSVSEVFGNSVAIVSGEVGGDNKPSTIRNGLTGETIRA